MSCTKVYYHTEQAAIVAADVNALRYPETRHSPYLCTRCNRWHLTTGMHTAQKLRLGFTTKEEISNKPQLDQQWDNERSEREYWLSRTMPKRGHKAKPKKIRHIH